VSKKRGNGEGSITKRKDGRWMARYTVHTAGPKQKTIMGRQDESRAQVHQKLTKAMTDRDGGLAFDSGKQTVGEYLDRWLEDSVRDNVKPRTLSNYRLQVREHLRPALGSIKLSKLTPAHVQSLYRAKLDEGLSPSSVRYIHAVLHRALKQAVKWGLMPRNVTEAVDLPKILRPEVAALSPDQARRFLGAAQGDRLEPLYQLAVRTGLRRGELLGLRWDDIQHRSQRLSLYAIRVMRQ
jgi:integrase